MYVTLGLIVILFTWAAVGLTQKSPQEDLREEIHKRMRDKILLGIGSDEDLFQDMEGLMDDMMKSSFQGFDNFSNLAPTSYKMNWIDSQEGRTLIITPENKEQRLDINVEDGLISIQGKTQKKGPHGSSISSFSNSFNVPEDLDWTKVRMEGKDGNILLEFPYKGVTKKIERTPIAPSKDDVQI
jgi:HSP20 family molecular chaperone IbpA